MAFSAVFYGIQFRQDLMGNQDGIIQRAVSAVKKAVPDLYVITDVCFCEYTDHGHCGFLVNNEVDNDTTLEILAKTALSHARAGADIVAPSDMMDGRVGAIRASLDEGGYINTSIMAAVAASIHRRHLDRNFIDIARMYGATPLQTLLKFRLPSAIPSLASGIRVAATVAPIGAIVGGFVALMFVLFGGSKRRAEKRGGR